MYSKKTAFVFFACLQALFCLHGQISYPSGGDGNGSALAPVFSGIEDNVLTFTLDGNISGSPTDSFEDWILVPGSGPIQSGTSNGAGSISITGDANSSFSLTYTPLAHFEGNATFDLNSSAYSTGQKVTHSFTIEMTGTNDPPRLKFQNYAQVSEVAYQDATYSLSETAQLAAFVIPSELDAGDIVTLSLPAGQNDNDRFSINQATGAINFISNTGADYENPVDSGNNNSYILTVRGTDTSFAQIEHTLTINILNIDEPPAIQPTGGLTTSIFEDHINSDAESFYNKTKDNSGNYFTLTVSDPDNEGGALPKWTLASAAARGSVYYSTTSVAMPMGTINELTTGSQVASSQIWIDYHPDANASSDDGTESFVIRALDPNNPALYDDFTVNITITPVNDDPPVWVTTQTNYSILETNSTNLIVDLDASDSDKTNTLTYSINGGADASKFSVISNTGELRFSSSMNYEDKSDVGSDDNFEVTVRVTDGTYSIDLPIVVNLQDVNEAPQIDELSNFSSSFSITEGGSWNMPADFLSGSDVDFGGDGAAGGGNDDNDSLTWSLVNIPNKGGLITWHQNTGTDLNFTYTPQNDSVVQFPESNQSQTETFTIKVEDSNGLYATKSFTASVDPIPDPPLIWKFQIDGVATDVTSYSTGQRLEFYYPENTSASTPIQIFVREYDNEPVTFSLLSDGTMDSTFFDLVDQNNTSSPFIAELVFKNSFVPDFENPTDAGNDNNYSIKINVQDQNSSDYQFVDIIITDQPEPPVIASPQHADPDSLDPTFSDFNVTISENSTFVTNLLHTDPDLADQNATVQWLKTGGSDQTRFEVNSTTGELNFVSGFIPNFENPLDVDGNNIYSVSFRVRETGTNQMSDQKTIHVKIRDINDFPVINPVPLDIDEPLTTNAKMVLSQYAQDDDNDSGIPDTLTWTERAGATSVFALDANGTLRFNQASDYESNQTSFTIEVRVSDGRGGYADANFTVDVNAQNEAPEFFDESNQSIYYLSMQTTEEIMISADLLSYSKDPEGDPITFSTTYDDSNGSHSLNFFTGAFEFTPKADYSGVTYIDILVTDGTNSATLPLNITVSEVPDPPVVYQTGFATELGGNTFLKNIQENNGTLVADLNASDPKDNPPSTNFIWTLTGPDASKFKMEPTQGTNSQLLFLQVPDFEGTGSQASADGDQIYEFNMTVLDDGNSTVVPVKVTVIDGPEDPFFDYGDGNQTVTYTEDILVPVFDVNASDHEGQNITYGLTGNGPDDANFSIDPATGVVSFESLPPDYEYPWGGSDLNGSNTYILEVNATDDLSPGKSDKIRHYIIVNVINTVEPPSFVNGSSFSINIWENNTAAGNASFDINVTTQDTNQSLVLEISGGADQNKFSLNTATNNLSFSNPNGQDFENPASADGDNNYEVQVQIVGTSITQDLTYIVVDRDDPPTILTTGLTQITLDENIPLAVDIDVFDQDGGGSFPDILYTVESNSSRFVEHNSSGTSINDIFLNPSTGLVNSSIPSATFSTAGDLNNDGDLDVISISSSSIYYMEGNGSGLFDLNTSTVIDDNGSGTPDYAIICDLDQDGDQDLLVSLFSDSKVMFYENTNPVGTFSSARALVFDRVGGGADFFSVGDMDGDYDLDIIVAYQTTDEVVWYANDGSTNFSLGGIVASSLDGLDQPRYLELIDSNNSASLGNRFQSPDILIAAKGGIYLSSNDGTGSFANSKIADCGSDLALVVRAVNLDGNQWPDLVYATSATGPPSYLLHSATGYSVVPVQLPVNTVNANWTVDTPTAIEIYTGPSIPPANYTGPTPNSPAIIVSDSALPYISIFGTSPSQATGVQVDNPVVISAQTGISSLVLSDLNRKENFIEYGFDGGSDISEFNATRFKNEGLLFFNEPYPNYELPDDLNKINRYKVWVTATDSSGLIAKELVSVKILDVNEPPIIITLDGNQTSSIDHVENLVDVIDINITHEENATQTIAFSLVGGNDQDKFSIDQTSGKLFFNNAPDFEAPTDTDSNNTYEVKVRVTDDGPGSAFVEQHIQVRVVDGSEPPEFNSSNLTNRSILEDGSLPLVFGVDINASDPNTGGGIAGYRILNNGMYGNATITGDILNPPVNFSYVPDGNFTGSDVVVVEVNNTAGLKSSLTLNISVTPVDDPPNILTSALINHPENQGHVILLSAEDDNNVTLNWSWGGGVATDSDFLLTSDGNLTFREVPDYEAAKFNNTYNKIIQVSDGVNTVDRNFTISVDNLNDNPPLSPYLTPNASSSFNLLENTSVVVDLNASDADNSIGPNLNIITYTITGGADRLRFDVSNAGRLQLLPAPDYENPNSADLDNIYLVELTLSDGGFSEVYPIVVTVTDADENNPTIISSGGLDTVSHAHPENQLAVLQVVATDIEPKPLVYSISGGQDYNLFQIDSQSGHLSFLSPPDYENPSDIDGNRLYDVWVRATDEGNTSDQQILNIIVTNVDELPTVSPSLFTTLEDVAIPVNFTVADPENAPATFSVITPPEFGEWTGSGNSFTYTPNPNYYGNDSITLRVSDGKSQVDTLVNLEINATNDPPTAVNDEYIYNDTNFSPLGLDILANDSNAPDQNGTETISLVSFSQPTEGNVSLAVGSSSLTYTPSTSFIGIDSFNYTISDGTLESNGTIEIIVSRASSLPSWRFLKKFGYYNQTAQNWIYHNDLGWLYLDEVANVETFTWMWHEDMGWFWTGDSYFPDLYLNDLSRWMSWKGSRTKGDNWTIYDQVDKQWLDAEKFKVARLNTVFSKLQNVDQVMDFVNSSPLFTDSERQSIATEFFFTGKSATLSSKGFTLAF